MMTATLETAHPLNQVPYQVKFAKTDLAKLLAELKKAESRRRELIVQGVSRPAEELEIRNIEKQIGTLRLKVDHVNIRIEGLIEDLPKVDVETRTQAGALEEAKEKLPKVLAELKQVDAETEKLCEDQAIKRLVTMVKQRSDLVEELTRTLPHQIMSSESYLHLAPTREFPKAPNKPEKVRDLVEALSK